jgi:hypothetical protein
MKTKPTRKGKRRVPKSVLRLPDLEVAKSAVVNSLSCPDAQRGYRHAIDEFVDWYCSEPRLSFSGDFGSTHRPLFRKSQIPLRRQTFLSASASLNVTPKTLSVSFAILD